MLLMMPVGIPPSGAVGLNPNPSAMVLNAPVARSIATRRPVPVSATSRRPSGVRAMPSGAIQTACRQRWFLEHCTGGYQLPHLCPWRGR